MFTFFCIFAFVMAQKPLIFISNDDGFEAQGIRELTRMMQTLGDVVVVAPDSGRSGAAGSITSTRPVRVRKVHEAPGLIIYACTGTPVDCAKLALERLMPRMPDLVVSGINHGDNASISVHYSGTMGVVLEACMQGLSAIGFSLRTLSQTCNFAPYEDAILDIARRVLQQPLPQDVCLNVNFPEVPQLAGVRWCRQCRGRWVEEWEPTEEADAFRLSGYFCNLEPEAEDTDYWSLDHGFASVVPLTLNMTAADVPSIL